MDNGTWPQLPRGFQLIAAYGVMIAAPTEWNPVLLRGHARGGLSRWLQTAPAPRGMIALADLRATRLEVRWRTLASPQHATRALDKTIQKLATARLQVQRQETAALITRPAPQQGLQALMTDDNRLYELHLPGKPNDATERIVEWFLKANTPASRPNKIEHLWSLYGCHGWAPRQARIEQLLLEPGRVLISLAWHGGKITLGSHALADRLLSNGKNLLDWAKSLHREGKSIGQWHVDGQRVTYSGTRLRKFCRRVHHELEFHHGPAANRITWQHRRRWGGATAHPSPAFPAEGIARTS